MSIRTILEDAVRRLQQSATRAAHITPAQYRLLELVILAYEEPKETSDPVIAASWMGRMVEADEMTLDGDRCPIKGALSSVSGKSCEVRRLGLTVSGFVRVWYPIHLVKEEAK